MSLRFVDGFDPYTPGQVQNKYLAYSASFDQNVKRAGRDDAGESFVIINTAFGECNYLQQLTPESVWGGHFDFQIQRLGTSANIETVNFFRFKSTAIGGGVQAQLRINANGSIGILDRSGNQVAVSSAGLIVRDTWYTLEFYSTWGSSAQLEVRINGGAWISGGFSSTAQPDQLGFRWERFGPPSFVIDNFVVYDGNTVDGIFAPFGRVRVTTLRPTADARLVWAQSSGGTAWQMVHDSDLFLSQSPDGDSTYIAAPGSASPQLFSLEQGTCYGLVLGVALDVAMRPNGAAFPVRLLTQPRATPYTIADITPGFSSYKIYQGIMTNDPDNSQSWTNAAINGGYWGISTPSGGTPRVSAVHLEQVVSLEPNPFDCGAGSYSF